VGLSYISEEVRLFIEKVVKPHSVDLLAAIPRMGLGERGMILEVEIKMIYNYLGVRAMDSVERFLNLNRLVELASLRRGSRSLKFSDKAAAFKMYILPFDLKIEGENFAYRL
jgi:hypothetical protein